jgi:hypothetical protein
MVTISNKIEGIWKEAVVTLFYLPSQNLPGETDKNKKKQNLSQYSR